MKKLLIILILTITSFSLYCHTNLIGFKGGLNISGVNDYDKDNFEPKFGYHFGMVFYSFTKDNLVINPGLFYTQKGYYNRLINTEFQFDYIEMPIVVKFPRTVDYLGIIEPYLGISFCHLLKAESSTNILGFNYTKNIFDSTNSNEINLTGGVDVAMNNHFKIGVRGSRAVTPLYKSNHLKLYNFNASISVELSY